MSIADNVASVRRRLESAAPGRKITLVAATKMNDAERVREAVAAGVDACGENRVQEMLAKNEAGAYRGAPLHFIGHLQRNKVKYVVGLADLIESADSPELLRAIDARAAALGIVQRVLVEVNIGSEISKSGVGFEGVPQLLAEASELGHVKVCGLMAIPPVSARPEDGRPYFARMRELFIDIKDEKYDNISMDILSMGMSGDFEIAAEEGATMVRVGTALFGPRNYGQAIT